MVSGKSSSGKSASLLDMDKPEGVMYLNCENGKKLPFKSKFKEYTVVDPTQVYEAFAEAEKMKDIHTIVIDSLTYLMDMYESTKVLNSTNTMQAWGQYAQYMKILMSQVVAKSTKNVVFLAHTSDVLNEAEMVNETMVKVKGSLMNQGIESFFTCVISTKKMTLTKLEDKVAKSPLFKATPDDKDNGFKYVFQTRLTKETVNERIRSPMGMWPMNETYIDNNLQNVINRLHQYYK
ncbi:uncharacterized protein METZ01_LOCUS235623 [marine metagenome]|uniref:Uncharacterized protein n=1 Tax=marine metagenome TaxID=408172 RepID=A0A382H6G9_9ZZZZ